MSRNRIVNVYTVSASCFANFGNPLIIITGVKSRGVWRFLVETIPKSVADILIYEQHYLRTSKGKCDIYPQRENKPWSFVLIFLKTRGNNLKGMQCGAQFPNSTSFRTKTI